MMSDPAVVAADKALRDMTDVLGDPGPELGAVMRDLAIAAARAALSPDTDTEVVTLPRCFCPCTNCLNGEHAKCTAPGEIEDSYAVAIGG